MNEWSQSLGKEESMGRKVEEAEFGTGSETG